MSQSKLAPEGSPEGYNGGGGIIRPDSFCGPWLLSVTPSSLLPFPPWLLRRLSTKIRDYYNYTVARNVRQDEAEIIAGLSMGLRMQVVMYLYREALDRVPLFKGKPPQFITSLVTFLKLEYYSPGRCGSWR